MGEVSWQEGAALTHVEDIPPDLVDTLMNPGPAERMMESSQHRQTKNRNDLESSASNFVGTCKLCCTNIIFQY